MKIKITNLKEYQEQIKQVICLVGAKPALKAVGMALQTAWRDWFKQLDREKSVYHHNFYMREGRSKTRIDLAKTSEKQAIVRNYSAPMAHKFFGGEIKAVNVKYLTIPLSEKAKSANHAGNSLSARRVVPDGFIIKSRRGNLFIATSEKGGKLNIHYLLKNKVMQKPHNYVLPIKSASGLNLVFKHIDSAMRNLIALYEAKMKRLAGTKK